MLVELRSALRGDEWNKQEFIDRIKILDEMIIDQCPSSVDNFDNFVAGATKKKVFLSFSLTFRY